MNTKLRPVCHRKKRRDLFDLALALEAQVYNAGRIVAAFVRLD
jgi:hypothetical protein